MVTDLPKMFSMLMIIAPITILAKHRHYSWGDCCKNHIKLLHECDKDVPHQNQDFYGCNSDVCLDGTVTTKYCGVGECDWEGCNCEGGCRQGSKNQLIEVFKARYNIEQAGFYNDITRQADSYSRRKYLFNFGNK